MRRLLFLTALLITRGFFVLAQESDLAQQKVAYQVPSRFKLALPVENTLSGYLGDRYEANLKNRLLKVDEKGLVAGFSNRPGVHRWIGEHVGKYLESAANTWAITKDPQLKTQMDRIAATLMRAQLPDGYLGTYLPENYWTSWDVWVHKYDIYGLLAYHKVTGNAQSLEVCKKIGDLLCRTFGQEEGKKNIIKAGSHVGMAATSVLDPMIDLYMWTGDKKYLEFCKTIIKAYNNDGGPAIVQTLLREKRVDKVANAKAYEMLSNILGILKLYRLTKEEDLLTVCRYAFDDIVSKRLYVTGTTSDHERFQDDGVLKADTSAHMGEGCVTTTWIQLNMQFFSLTGERKYYNEIEKSIYNHLLAAENPITGCVSYYTPMMGVKPYACHITCCMSSVPRGIAFIPYLNYGKLQNNPTVLMYESAKITDSFTIPGEVAVPFTMQIVSAFPRKGTAAISLSIPKPSSFTLQLRVPVWAKSFVATINGQSFKGVADELVKINRTWKTGDRISVSFDMPLMPLDGDKSYPGYVAYKRGPQVMAFDSQLNYLVSTPVVNKKASVDLVPADASELLPAGWQGREVFALKNNDQVQPMILVPFADAGQTGGVVNVWIPASERK